MSDDEHLPGGIIPVTSLDGGDLISINGQWVEVFSTQITASGIVFKLEDDREFIFDPNHHHRARKLKPRKPTISK
jgi:hypothetical protein